MLGMLWDILQLIWVPCAVVITLICGANTNLLDTTLHMIGRQIGGKADWQIVE